MKDSKAPFWIIVGFALLMVFLVNYYKDEPKVEQEHPIQQYVTEITLEIQGFEKNKNLLPVMGLGYAKWVNFDKVIFKGESHIQVGSGASFVKKSNQTTQYTVREKLQLRKGLFVENYFEVLEIRETVSGKLIAKKQWYCSTRWCGSSAGFPGQGAALFIKEKLNPDMPIGGAVGVKKYPATVSVVQSVLPLNSIPTSDLNNKLFSCPTTVSLIIRKDLHGYVVSTEKWVFQPANNIRQVYCLNKGIFITSSTFPNDLFLDWISYSGELLGQFYIPQKGVDTLMTQYVSDLSHRDGKLTLRALYFDPGFRQLKNIKASSELLVEIDIDSSAKLHKK